MNYFSPSTGRTVSSGTLSTLLGNVPTDEQLRELGYYPLENPYSSESLASHLLIQTGNAQQGEDYIVTHSVNPDILSRLHSLINYERSLIGKITIFAQSYALSVL